MLTISNDYISVSIKEEGAELCSYIDKSNNREVIWIGDAQYWKRHSPVLFPLIGKIENNTFKFENKEYNLPPHGFARDKKFTIVVSENDRVVLQLKNDAETIKGYPFEFVLEVELTLNKKELKTTYRVINPSTTTIYFCLGAHPGINVPMKEGLVYNDYQLSFEKEENSDRLLLTPEGFRTGEVAANWLKGDTLPLSEDLFKEDALVFDSLKSSHLFVESKKGGDKVKVGWENYPDMGIWKSYNGSPFVCIEPWNGMCDQIDLDIDFSEKKGIVKLEGKGVFECAFTIENFIG